MDNVKIEEPGSVSGDEGVKPLYVGLAIVTFFPLGFYLLKNHPVLSREKAWWAAGAVWVILGGWFIALYAGMFFVCLMPILIPLGIYLKKKNPGLTFSTLLRRDIGFTAPHGQTGVGIKSKWGLPELAEGEVVEPQKVALAIFFFFPLGLYLLWNHPTLSRDKTWWRVGGVWSFLVFMGAVMTVASIEAKNKKSAADNSSITASAGFNSSTTTEERRLMLVEAERLWDAGQHEAAVSKYSEFFRSWPSGVGTLGGGDKRAFGSHLPKFYARFIQHSLDAYQTDPVRYAGELKIAKQQLDYANKNGVPVPTDLSQKVWHTQKGIDDAYAAKGKKYKTFKAVVAKFKKFPDPFAGMTERQKFNEELGKLVDEFDAVPFDANIQADEGKWIVELFESDVQGRYSGQIANEVEQHVRKIELELLNRK